MKIKINKNKSSQKISALSKLVNLLLAEFHRVIGLTENVKTEHFLNKNNY